MTTSDFRKNTSLILALLLTLMSVSCGGATDPDTETTTEAATIAPEDTTDNDPRKNAKDDLPSLTTKARRYVSYRAEETTTQKLNSTSRRQAAKSSRMPFSTETNQSRSG